MVNASNLCDGFYGLASRFNVLFIERVGKKRQGDFENLQIDNLILVVGKLFDVTVN